MKEAGGISFGDSVKEILPGNVKGNRAEQGLLRQ